MKIPVTPPGMEPATFRLVARCLNRLRYGVPRIRDAGIWSTGYPKVASTTLCCLRKHCSIHRSLLGGCEMCIERGGKQFEQFEYLFTVTLCLWLVDNKVALPWNMGEISVKGPVGHSVYRTTWMQRGRRIDNLSYMQESRVTESWIVKLAYADESFNETGRNGGRYDIFVNCNWVANRWQQYSTHLHTNSTQHDTKHTIHRTIQHFWKSAGHAPTLQVIPWRLPYNWVKSTEKPQSG
jgi:hypothetical protein